MAKRLRKKEILFIEKRSKELDLEVMEAFVINEVENVEQHIYIYIYILKALWQYKTRPNPRIWKLLEFLQGTFCQLFGAHYKGKERFGRFLAAWYKEVGTLAFDKLSTHNTSTLWSYLKSVKPFVGILKEPSVVFVWQGLRCLRNLVWPSQLALFFTVLISI